MVRFPFTAQCVAQSRRRQTAYDGLERLSHQERVALGFDTGGAQSGDVTRQGDAGFTVSDMTADRD